MKHLTLFFSICWLYWFSQIFAISTICGLSDVPPASVISLGNNASELVSDSLEDNEDILPISLSNNNKSNITNTTKKLENQKTENDFVVLSEIKTVKTKNIYTENISTNDYNEIINDSGGTTIENDVKIKDKQELEDITFSNDDNSNNNNDNMNESIILNEISSQISISSTPSSSSQQDTEPVNLTIEENPIPVFSEWAQKQMEEAEKKLEKKVVNSSSSKKNATAGSKLTPIKLRAKNYASPDCGAKIIASNAEAQNTAALLSPSKDEYMLSPCKNRIWFVIELCEAIQLEKVDLANFELFSSSPKNFSVSVSNRFPTREWSNVGKFIAEDNRNIQRFDLFPHLFGKFVRVDVHSHYNSEHFCPISLFHVYGTSEFEAFETENRLPNDDLDEYDDDDDQPASNLRAENNLFKSASDAVISIVKKAAEVLRNTNSNKTELSNGSVNMNLIEMKCISLKTNFTCDHCNQSFVNCVNYLISCKYLQIIELLKISSIKRSIKESNICTKIMNKVYNSSEENCINEICNVENKNRDFLLYILPTCYQIALCYLSDSKEFQDYSKYVDNKNQHFNSTIKGNKFESEFLVKESLANKGRKQKIKQSTKTKEDGNFKKDSNLNQSYLDAKKDEQKKENKMEDNESLQTLEPPPSLERENQQQQQQQIEADDVQSTENVNIFNLMDNFNTEAPEQDITASTDDKKLVTEENPNASLKTEEIINKSKNMDTEQGTWESIDKILSDEQTSGENLNSNSGNNDGSTIGKGGNTGNSEHQVVQKVQSESIFIRLSNRIKALERNMSLSGQYLEELSRRYKKQVEELQHSFTKTLSAIEEQNRNAVEREHLLAQQNKNLEENVNEITVRLNSCISLLIFLIPFVVVQFLVSWYFIRSSRRQHLEIIQRIEDETLITTRRVAAKKSKKLNRRKSIEGVVEQIASPPKKPRRPSEEAMRISGSYKDLLINESKEINTNESIKNHESSNVSGNNIKKLSKQRQRKISIFYGKTKDNDRLESVSENLNNSNATSPSTSLLLDSPLNDKLILDDDYENYLPGSDLMYNEFMPDGPSGVKIFSDNSNTIVQSSSSTSPSSVNIIKQQKKSSKIRKLSSPKFLKFNKFDNKKLPHGPTSWEWYRSKKSNNNNMNNSKYLSVSPTSSQSAPSTATINNETTKNKEFFFTPTENTDNVNGFLSSSTNSSINSDIMKITNKESFDSVQISDTNSTTTINSSHFKNGNNSKKQSSFRKILKKVF